MAGGRVLAAAPGQGGAQSSPLRADEWLVVALAAMLVLLQPVAALAGPAELALVAIAILAALPHGGADLPLARNAMRPRLGPLWLPAFLLGYLALAGVTVLVWLLDPGLGLSLFLGLSLVHFGLTDAGSSKERGSLSVFVLGAAPLMVPAGARPEELSAIYAALAGAGGEALARWSAEVGLWLWLLAAVVAVARWLRQGNQRAVLLLLLVAGLFLLLPPLTAFALYFGLLHAPRALRETSEQTGQRVATLLRDSMRPSLAALTFIAVAFAALQRTTASTDAALMALFIGLSALTVPHMAMALLTPPRRRS